MSQQLVLFDFVNILAPKTAKPTRQAGHTAKKVSSDFVIEACGDYFTVYHQGLWIGSIFHLGGKIWNLYFPNERGVCGFGGPKELGAAEELYRCWIEEGKAAK